MSVDTGNAPADGGNTSGDTPPATGGFQPITTQDDLNRVISERVKRERDKFSDYADIKAKAERVDAVESAAAEKVAAAEAELAAVPAKVAAELRTHLVALHDISSDDADLFLTATDPALLVKQVQRLTARGAGTTGSHVPREGNPSTPKPDDARTAVRALFGNGNP